MTIFQISPYAAKAIVYWSWTSPAVSIWLVFRFPMDQTVKPAHALWKPRVSGIARGVSVSTWLDAYTILLTVPFIFSMPTKVDIQYEGPDDNLRTTWDKQWEPWGYILGILYPVVGLTATYTFGGGVSGDIATMTFQGGVLTAVTLVP